MTETTQRSLRYDFTAVEIHDLSKVVGIETMTDYDHNLFTQEGVEGDFLDAGKELREGLAENGMTIKGGSGKPGDPVVIEVDEKKRKRKK